MRSKKLILSPSWSPNQQKIAYISYKNDRAEAFVVTPYLKTTSIKLPKFDGIVSSPSWHPNGESILLSLSNNNNQDVYSYNLKSASLKRLTTHIAIDTEANYSPNGKSIVFTSKRSGQEQIYIKNLKTGVINLVPIAGNYNAKSVFSPDGTKLALIHRIKADDRLALFNIKTSKLEILTKNKLDSSPSFSPNGEMIIFSTKRDKREILSIISLQNNQIVELMQKKR